MAEGKNGAAKPAAPAAAKAEQSGPTIRWEDTNMRSAYANVCNVSSTREEVVLLFGMNQGWHAGQQEVVIQLSDRVVLSPFAAKRLQVLLGNVLREYESRFGALEIDAKRASEGPQSTQ
jgi:hypothetical protein